MDVNAVVANRALADGESDAGAERLPLLPDVVRQREGVP